MNELIPISTSGQGLPTVSGRELHRFLGNRKHFADWMKGRIKQYKLVEGQDYTSVSLNGETGGRIIEYVLTLDTAKELSMVERTERGKQARQYFIEAEKRLQQITTQPNQLLTHLDKRITDLEQ
ncbi:antA/AntB antirepressor family protein, partial [Spirosoma terrae]